MSSFSRSSSHLDSVRSSRVYPASENSHLENEVTDLPHSQVGWKALLSFTTKSHTVILGLSLGLSIASGIVIPTMAIFLGMIFDVFTDFGRGKIAEGQFLSKISTNAFYLVGLGLVSWGLNGGYFLFWLMFGELQAKSARDKLYAGMLEKEIEWYDMRRAGIKAMIPRIQTQIRELQTATSQPLGFAVQYTTTLIVGLGLALYTAWDLTLVTLATVPIGTVLLSWISRKMQPAIESQTEELTQASKLANSSISGIDTVKCCNGQWSERMQYFLSIRKAARYYLIQARANALQMGLVRLLMRAMFVQGFWYGSHIVENGKKSSGQILTAFWACIMATQSFEQILPQMIVLEKGRAAAATLQAILVKIDRGQRVSNVVGLKTPIFCEGDIILKEVCFQYPSRPGQLALDNVNFFFPAGETTFVIGKSGSGKSTLSNLLLQFYRPGSGQITLDGESIHNLDPNWLRNNITLVQQQTVLFDETIFRNIAFGRKDHTRVARRDVREGIELADLQDTILQLPQGLDTPVGTGGNAMSGGQRQRVAIARARLRDTPILILDEATSALDNICRDNVIKAIRKWRQNKTTIIITHDISQILLADYVYVLHRSKIVEEGFRGNLDQNSLGPFKKFLRDGNSLPGATLQIDTSISIEDDIHPLIESPTPFKDDQDSMKVHVSQPETMFPKTYYMARSTYQPSPRQADFISRMATFATLPLEPPLIQDAMLSDYRQQAPHELLHPVPTELEVISSEPSKEVSFRRFQNAPPTWDPGTRMAPIKHRDIVPEHLPSAVIGPPAPNLDDANQKQRLKAKVDQVMALKDIFKTVWPNLAWSKRVRLILGFSAALIHAAATPIFSWLFSRLLASFFLPSEEQAHESLVWSLSVLAVAVTDASAACLMHYLLESCGQAWVDNLRLEALKRILDQPRTWFDEEENKIQCLTECLDRGGEEMRNLIGRFAGFLFVAVVMMTISCLWCMALCWKLTLVGLSTAPFLYCLTQGFELISSKFERKTNDAGAATGGIFSETFENIRTIRALTLEGFFHKRYILLTTKALRVGIRRSIVCGAFFGLSDACIVFITALLFWYGSMLASTGEYHIDSIMTVLTMLLFSIANANVIVGSIPQISASRDTASRVLRLCSMPLGGSHEHEGKIRLAKLPSPLRMVDLTFTYPTRPSYTVLRSLNLTIPLGTSVAIIGSSGSGKSTIASLLMKLYTPSQTDDSSIASISFGSYSISDLRTDFLRSSIAYIPQNVTIFPTTITQNITYGLSPSSAYCKPEEVTAAAKLAGLHSFITSLPSSYNTLIGEGGTTLSGGQVQRIGIARALVRGPQAVIMDEPTSNLDTGSARRVRNVVKRLVSIGVTVIAITHDKEMMKVCGRVVVLKDGKVVKDGKPDATD